MYIHFNKEYLFHIVILETKFDVPLSALEACTQQSVSVIFKNQNTLPMIQSIIHLQVLTVMYAIS
jgi:hypothetical protein